METIVVVFRTVVAEMHSDPTYEAWKHKSINNSCNHIADSDPTYEAWKHQRASKGDIQKGNSDPTYEAWKQPVINSLNLRERTPILPMRHGNSF